MANFVDPNYEYDAPMFVDFQIDKGQDEDVDRWFDSKDGDEGGVAFDDQTTEEEMIVEEDGDSDAQPATDAPSKEPQGIPSSSQSGVEINVQREKHLTTPITNTLTKNENESDHTITSVFTKNMVKPAQTTASAKKKRATWIPPRRSMRISKMRSDSTASVSSVTSQCSTSSARGMRKTPKIKAPLKITVPSTPEFMKRLRSKHQNVNQKTREEEELDRIAKMQKQMASKRKETEQYMKKALLAQPYMPHRSDEDNLTHIEEFNFATDQRVKSNAQNVSAKKEKPFETTLRQHPPSPSFKNRGITKPVPFQLSGTNLSKKRKEPDSDNDPCGGYEAMALSVYKFQKQTPPRFHTRPLKEQNVGPEPITAKERALHKVTKPKTPTLSSKERKRPLPADCLSREQQEENEFEEMKNYKFKAREFDPRIVAEQGNLGVKPLPRKAITETKPFAFEYDPLQQSKQEEPTEGDKLALFKARPAPDFEKVFKPETKNQSTEFQAFSFEAMDRSRYQKKDHNIQAILEEEKKAHSAFQAQLLPSFTPPPQPTSTKPLTDAEPFNLATENRGAVKAEKWIKKVQDELQEQRKKQVFKAHSSNVVHNAPFKPKKSLKQITEFEEFGMHSEKRAEEREIYEMQKREREEESSEMERQQKKEQEEQEKINIAILRKQLVHKSNPIRRFKGVEVQRSTVPLTEPSSPVWQERRKKLRI